MIGGKRVSVTATGFVSPVLASARVMAFTCEILSSAGKSQWRLSIRKHKRPVCSKQAPPTFPEAVILDPRSGRGQASGAGSDPGVGKREGRYAHPLVLRTRHLHRLAGYAIVPSSASSKRPLCRVACSIQEPRIACAGSSHVRRCCIPKGKYAGSPRRFVEADTARPLWTGHSFITFIHDLQYKESIHETFTSWGDHP